MRQATGNPLTFEDVRHQFGLVRWDDPVVEPLEEDDRGIRAARHDEAGERARYRSRVRRASRPRADRGSGPRTCGCRQRALRGRRCRSNSLRPRKDVVKRERAQRGIAARRCRRGSRADPDRHARSRPCATHRIRSPRRPPRPTRGRAARETHGRTRCCRDSRHRVRQSPGSSRTASRDSSESLAAPVGPPWLMTISGGNSPSGARHDALRGG